VAKTKQARDPRDEWHEKWKQALLDIGLRLRAAEGLLSPQDEDEYLDELARRGSQPLDYTSKHRRWKPRQETPWGPWSW
jgi:hypothetical protein